MIVYLYKNICSVFTYLFYESKHLHKWHNIWLYFSEPPPASPLILTSQQLAQLTQAGVLQLNNATTTNNGLNTSTLSSTTTTAPLVIKSEPNPLSMGATPTIQSLPHNVSQEDVSFPFSFFCYFFFKFTNLNSVLLKLELFSDQSS